MSHDAPALALTEDILLEIFFVLQSNPVAPSVDKGKPGLPIAVILSHVTRQWRGFVINSPLLWAKIQVTTSLRLDALREIISRSGECELDVSFLSPPFCRASTQNRHLRESLHHRDSASLLAPCVARWRRLCIIANPSSMQYIMDTVTNVLFSRLQILELKLTPNHSHAPIPHFGPLHFNPHIFATLHLHRVVIYPAHPSHFSGLHSLQLSQTSYSIIDRLRMNPHNPFPAIPIPIDAPSMVHLSHLSISTPSALLPALLSFTPTNLTTVALSSFHCTSTIEYTTLISLYRVLINAGLEELVLAGIDGGAWDALLEFLGTGVGNGLTGVIHENRPKFPTLKRLTLQSLALVDQRFATVFPNIERLTLVDVVPSLVLAHDKIDRLSWRELKILVRVPKIESPHGAI